MGDVLLVRLPGPPEGAWRRRDVSVAAAARTQLEHVRDVDARHLRGLGAGKAAERVRSLARQHARALDTLRRFAEAAQAGDVPRLGGLVTEWSVWQRAADVAGGVS